MEGCMVSSCPVHEIECTHGSMTVLSRTKISGKMYAY